MAKDTKMPKPKMPRMTGGAGSGIGRLQKSHLPVPKKGK